MDTQLPCLAALPDDVILEIISHLSLREMYTLFTSCKDLSAFLKKESLYSALSRHVLVPSVVREEERWRELSFRSQWRMWRSTVGLSGVWGQVKTYRGGMWVAYPLPSLKTRFVRLVASRRRDSFLFSYAFDLDPLLPTQAGEKQEHVSDIAVEDSAEEGYSHIRSFSTTATLTHRGVPLLSEDDYALGGDESSFSLFEAEAGPFKSVTFDGKAEREDMKNGKKARVDVTMDDQFLRLHFVSDPPRHSGVDVKEGGDRDRHDRGREGEEARRDEDDPATSATLTFCREHIARGEVETPRWMKLKRHSRNRPYSVPQSRWSRFITNAGLALTGRR